MVDLIRLLAQILSPAIAKYRSHLISRNVLQPPKVPKQYSQVILSVGVLWLQRPGLILRVLMLLCVGTLTKAKTKFLLTIKNVSGTDVSQVGGVIDSLQESFDL